MQLVILGGGVAGLSAWRRALAAGLPVTLVEKCVRPGGLTRSIHVGGYTFDYTGHFLHLAATAHPAELGDRSGRGTWRRIARRAGCLVGDRVVPAPFQYHLGALPEPMRTACIDGVGPLISGGAAVQPEPGEHLLDYFVRAFGPGVTAHFLKPYNEKLLATDLTRLSAVRLNRFFPAPDPSAIRAGLEGSAAGSTYNATFWYPEGDGIGRLVEQLAPAEAHEHATVTGVDPERRVVVADGREIPYTHLISTLPLPNLLMACGGAWAARAARLSGSGVAAFQLGVGGPPAAALRDLHWLYVADPALSFFRVGCYSNVSASMAPVGCHSLYVEVGFAAGEPLDGAVRDPATSWPQTGSPFAGRPGSQPLDWAALTERVLADLARAGLLDPARVEVLLRHAIVPAYVHFDFAWELIVPAALADLAACGIHCAGRYGRWDYLGMEDVILEAAALVDRLHG